MLKISDYVTRKGTQPLPPEVCERLFESYLSGSSLKEVCKMYSEYDPLAIHYSAYHYDWPLRRDDIAIDMQERVKQKILTSKFQQLELVESMIKVAHIEAITAFQAFIKHPSEKNIPKVFRIKSIKDLSEAIGMMSQIVGQESMKRIEIVRREEDPSDEKSEARGTRTKKKDDLSEDTAKDLISAINKTKK